MRILVQQRQSGLYFKDINNWAHKSSEAMDFVNSTAAIDFCAANHLTDVQIVLKFEEEKTDIVIPVIPPGQHQDRPASPV